KPPVKLKGKTVIVADDGIATGKTMIAALELIRMENPKQIVAVVPVGPLNTIRLLKEHADKVICLESDPSFFAIGQYYEDFGEVSDQEVKELLHRSKAFGI